MSECPRTKELYKLCFEHLHYEWATGKLIWKKRTSNRIKVGDEAGVIDIKKDGRKYRRISIRGHKVYAHRVIMMMVHGPFLHEVLVDHRDGDGLNNRYDNLRFADAGLNAANLKGLRTNNTSGVTGVTWWKTGGYWVARITIWRRVEHLGYFKRFEDAVAARKAAEEAYKWIR